MKLASLLLICFCFYDLNAQIEFFECPKEKKYEFVSNVKLISKYSLGKDSIFYNWKIDTGSCTVFKYEQHYDCSKNGHFATTGSFIWSIPKNSTKFEIQIEKIDSPQNKLVYYTVCGPPCRLYNFEMNKAEGRIEGFLDDNVWHVKGQIKMLLLNRNSGATASHYLIVDGMYILWKQKIYDKKGFKFNGF